MIKSALIEIRSVLGASLVAVAMALPPHTFAHDAAMHAAPTKATRAELATAAAFGPDGQLYAVSKNGGHLQLIRSHDDGNHWSAPLRVNAQPEPIAADGDSQPRIAFNRDGDLLVSWTKPLPRPYTGEIRLARLPVGAAAFDAPITVHHDRAEITHRFQNILAGPDGRITAVWIDKRDQEAAKAKREPYRGAAIYAAVSTDGGRSFAPEVRVADHSCECCRIALAADRDGAPIALWRHVFAPDERDHAIARLKPDGSPERVDRATFDRWRVDACPHHGPALAVDEAGTRHATWFNVKDDEGRVFYGRIGVNTVEGQIPVGGPRAAHADIAIAGGVLAIVWKEFDGEQNRLRGMRSTDGGRSFETFEIAATAGAADQPRALVKGGKLYAFWRQANEGFRLYPLP
ncbi:exo-alpha-sialidase [uncultured Zoogloea sp.]|uniref:exo-alpha-sialidase n=1 Tax=uncultured Zoogloea sp. TaxID=160237 RepID=UPI0026320857|nr:exo-alpha-sialidase [uncultured Zoogloea sp.]